MSVRSLRTEKKNKKINGDLNQSGLTDTQTCEQVPITDTYSYDHVTEDKIEFCTVLTGLFHDSSNVLPVDQVLESRSAKPSPDRSPASQPLLTFQ